ncbi:MAG TPA: flavoprotein [Candidatus Omnitrophota bacterium]|nr:flavoprotein [Candidatus Omnitrophota bacterium]
MGKQKKIILGVTASVAIYKACELVRRLKDKGYALDVVMTEDSKEFIRPILFESLAGSSVHSGLFTGPTSWDIEHVSLADKADLVLIAPATAHIIAKLAAGLCDDLLSCVVCATRAPVLICPAMNENMFVHPITRQNIKKLETAGYRFVQPRKGMLACGKEGAGCLAEVETIVKEVGKILAT